MTEVTVYNTLSQSVEVIRGRGLDPTHINMYVCGPTVYDSPHVGHARSYLFFDTLKRVLRLCGYTVTHLQNFSDIDEKIDKVAAKNSVSPRSVADMYINEFFRDMDILGVQRADRYVRASENTEFMHMVTSRFLEEGLCYLAGNNIYFDASSGGGFGSLLHSTLDELICGNEADSFHFDKRDKEDFTLWIGNFDRSNPYVGRPSWNLECFSIVHRWFGCELDIQGGGMDLIFPHHEVGSVISKAFCKEEFASYYIHNGFVTMNEDKMSKSLGNFITVAQLLSRYPAGALRLYLLSAPFRENIEFDDERLSHYAKLYSEFRERLSSCRGDSNDERILSIVSRNLSTHQLIDLLETELDTMTPSELHSSAAALGIA